MNDTRWVSNADPIGELAIKLAAEAHAAEEEHGEWTWRDIAAAIAATRTPSAETTRALVEALEEALGWILDTDDEGAEDWGVVHEIRAALSLYRSETA